VRCSTSSLQYFGDRATTQSLTIHAFAVCRAYCAAFRESPAADNGGRSAPPALGSASQRLSRPTPKPTPGPHQVYGFLTTSPNAVVEPIQPKAMP
jgi:hypothetical protein